MVTMNLLVSQFKIANSEILYNFANFMKKCPSRCHKIEYSPN